MEPYKKRLHLDRTEVAFLLGLIFIVSSLMFSFGILIGFGLRNGGNLSGVVSQISAKDKKAEAHGEKTDRHPASVAGEKKVEETDVADELPGSELRRDFREAKQRSLVDMNLRTDKTKVPKSIADASAHLKSHADWNRNPSSEDLPVVAEADSVGGVVENKATPPGVKGLFERKPSSFEKFSPMPSSFTVQIASYATRDESEAKVRDLIKDGFKEAYVQDVKFKNGEVWWRVSVGSFPSADWAKKTGEKLIKRKMARDFVIRQVN